MKGKKRVLSMFLSFMMVFSLFSIPSMTVNASSKSFDLKSVLKSKRVNYKDIDYKRALAQKYGTEIPDNAGKSFDEQISPEDYVRVVVQVDKPSVMDMVKGKNQIMKDMSSLEAEVEKSQSDVKNLVKRYGEIKHTYKCLINGFSASVKYKDIEGLRNIKGVKEVTIANKFYLDMNVARGMSKVEEAWRASGLKGEGTVIAIIDTGIDYNHKDMRLTDPSKAKLDNDAIELLGGPGKYYSEKVPYGYNFADQNDQILDIYGSMHGMHVAGIVAANGLDDEVSQNLAIKGVAPEAQLLALKVFTNNNIDMPSAYTDDVVAAIEDAVKHKADVINMSLGSTAGFVRPEDPEQVAIKNATDAGVVVVVSGGNSEYATKDVFKPYTLDPDIGVSGTPGIAPDAVQVASIENAGLICEALDYSGSVSGIMAYLTTDVKPVGVLNGEYDIIDCGFGLVTDFNGKDLTNKIALIQRGTCTFIDKQINAQNAGAVGAIVYNKDGDESYVSMASDPSIRIPAVFIKNSDGLLLKSNILQGIKVSFNGKMSSVANANGNKASDYSSWGSTPDLQFKPEVTAPGGNIYSTVNSNKYDTMSGTSMASPYTAGSAALVVQYLEDMYSVVEPRKASITQREFAELAKKILISTAEPVIDPNVKLPYLARKQGAGLINVEKAVKTKAYVTGDDGNATIALKEIGNTTQFGIVINNIGDKELVFDICDDYGVLTNRIIQGYIFPEAKKIGNANVSFDKSTVTVPPNGKVEVNAMLNIPLGTMSNIFAEGFITLKSNNEEQPSLGIPYMGFYGKWSGQTSPRVFDAPMWEKNDSYFGMTTLLSKDGYYLGLEGKDENDTIIINKDHISFSPNDDGEKDDVMPLVSFMRNAKEFTLEVLDKDGNLVRKVAYNKNIRKNFTDRRTLFATYDDSWAWDGKIYNAQTGNLEVAPEGSYTVRLIGVPDFENAEPYILDMPVKLDLTAPKFDVAGEKLEGNNYKIKVSNSEDNVGISSYITLIFVEGQDEPAIIEEMQATENEKIVSLPNNVVAIVVSAVDYADNMAVKYLETQNNTVTIEPLNLVDGLYTSSKNMTIKYAVNDMLTPSLDHIGVTVDGNPEVNNEKNFSYELRDLKEGLHSVTIRLYSGEGKNIGENSVSFIVDTTAPVITIIDPVESPKTIENGENTYMMQIKVLENLSGYRLYINDSVIEEKPIEAGIGLEKEHKYVVELKEGETRVIVKAVDAVNNEAIPQEVIFNSGFNKPIINVTSPNADTPLIAGKNVLVAGNVVYKQDQGIKVTINGEEVEVGNDGAFSKDITFEKYGEEKITILAVADDQNSSVVEMNITLSPLSITGLDKENRLFTSTPSAAISYTLDAADVNIDKVKVTVDEREPVEKSKEENSIEITDLTEGIHRVLFEVINTTGDVIASLPISLIYDANPAITFDIKDEDGNVISRQDLYNRNEIKATGNISEEVKELKFTINYTENGEEKTKEPIFANVNGLAFDVILKLEEGMNRVTVSLTDLSGNVNEYQMKVFVDTIVPNVVFEQPTEDVVNVSAEETIYTFKFMVSDNTYGYSVYVNEEKIDDVDGELGIGTGEKLISYDYTVPAGENTVLVKVVDRAGNAFEKLFRIISGNEFVDAVVGISEANYDKKAPNDVDIPVVFNSDKLFKMSIENRLGDVIKTDLIKDEDFILDADKVIVKSSFLQSLPVGERNLIMSFKSGKVSRVKLNIADTRQSDSLLKSIMVNGNIIAGFDTNRLNYVVEMSPFDASVPEVSCELYDSSATFEITQAHKIGDAATIKVTAGNGEQRVYSVRFIVPLTIQNMSGVTEFVKGKPATVTIKASNISDNDKMATLLIGIYDINGNFIDYMEGKYTIKPNESVDMSATLNTLNSSAYKIKCFIWDNMNPLSQVYEFLIK